MIRKKIGRGQGGCGEAAQKVLTRDCDNSGYED